ncbi:MAG TPA: heparan-alpha-glucosaminide N-acetyltransferase domain-containing protein [Vicinamibacterales bacterium]|nr:heparan-alpha-glucosaminide N-acetyltransferase domain-containing protein [Vicinamibacterales bacterium]
MKPRLASIDVLRGIVMILMALDHVRDYIGLPGNPTDVTRASAALFFTRWITHFCAPVFFLLTGTGAYLGRARPRFLITRGLWLIVLELTALRCLGYQFNFDYRVTMLVILWALGWSMIVLGLLVRFPVAVIAAFAGITIAGHNLLDGIRGGPLFTILHGQGVVSGSSPFVVFVAYPIVPWIGVTAAGYCLGIVFTWSAEARRRFLVRAGAAAIALFVVLRLPNIYGDPVKWKAQAIAGHTVLSVLNATKYPPSLLFLLMTLGPALLVLAWLDGKAPRFLSPALTLGRVPMFYFLLHLPLIHLIAVLFCYARYGAIHWMFESPTLARYPFTSPPGWGWSLPVVYAVWIGVVAGLYPVCCWYADVKQRSRHPLLSYL